MPPHLLVTNDFPPKVGGIQTYLWELWRRLPPGDVTVLTTAQPGGADFDADQPYRTVRWRRPVLLPTPALASAIDDLADEVGAKLVVLDPVLPLGALGRRLRRPYALVMHGSELVGRVPPVEPVVRAVVAGAAHVIAAGPYAAAETARLGGRRTPPVTDIPPGVDTARFRPLDPAERAEARRSLGIAEDALVVVGISRLVPRKGFDVLIRAAAELAPRYPGLVVAIGGRGRDHRRLLQLVEHTGAPVRLLGAVPAERLPRLHGLADVFAMCCRTRWRGLEPEGFGIVFLEAAACGVPQVAGASGGAADAVVDGGTGLVVASPDDPRAVARVLERLLADAALRRRLGGQALERARDHYTYDRLAGQLAGVLDGLA
ncbi:MAG TPA: glycosyltransferase family 4 protein [Acidimicrobiales bacterium]|nr:glycosyltransferase family 4 protein [Acidimicrobiales bacterium]